jgi:hypothetical protein
MMMTPRMRGYNKPSSKSLAGDIYGGGHGSLPERLQVK